MEGENGDTTEPDRPGTASLRRFLIHPVEAARVFLPESPIEARLSRLVLDVAPGLDVTAWYIAASGFRDVDTFLARAACELGMPNFLVFPQVGVESYRLDFVIAVRRRASVTGTGYAVFAVEADGAEFHAGRAAEDIVRQRAIQRATGWPVLRFSGAEIMYATHRVGDVLEAQVETFCADFATEPGSPKDLARAKLQGLVADLTQLPVLRHEFVHPAAAEALDRLRRLLDELQDMDGNGG